MKQKLLGRLAAAVVLLLSATTATAHDFVVDGIYYKKNSSGTSVSVTFKGNTFHSYNSEYSGAVTIPASVDYSGKTYSVTSIGEYAFADCRHLTSVEIPNSITSIGECAFSGYSDLTSVEIPNSVTEIKRGTFEHCSLTSVKIPNSVTKIYSLAFYGCSHLTSVEIPNSVTSIGESAFSYCSGLTAVKLHNSVTSIGDHAFSYCSGLTAVEIPNSVTSIGESAFSYCSGLTAVEIPNSVTSIGDYAFAGCNGLKLACFNAKNCSIEDYAFSSSDLTLVIGADVEQIRGCILKSANANKIVTQATTPPVITAQTFESRSCPLYVSKVAYAKYWAADIWGEFSDIRQIENPITEIELNERSINLGANITTQLTASITPSNATLTDIYWASDNPAVASVDQNGNVTVFKRGIATITAMAVDGSGVKATCQVSFIAENLTLNPSELTLAINQSAKITPVITPEDISSTSLEWSTSNAEVALYKVNSDGTISVLGVSDGVATITCRTTDGSNLTATCEVTVGTGAVDGIEADAVAVEVRGENGVIRIEGAEDAKVEVFNAAGVCVFSGVASEIPVAQRGIYVVKVAGRATKIAL